MINSIAKFLAYGTLILSIILFFLSVLYCISLHLIDLEESRKMKKEDIWELIEEIKQNLKEKEE